MHALILISDLTRACMVRINALMEIPNANLIKVISSCMQGNEKQLTVQYTKNWGSPLSVLT